METTQKTVPTEEQKRKFRKLFRQLTNADQKKFCQGLLRDHGIEIATNYAELVLVPIFKHGVVFSPYKPREKDVAHSTPRKYAYTVK